VNTKRILLIDDDRAFTTILKLNLQEFDVCVENHALQAVETAHRFKPDLVLLDIVMPEADGGAIAGQFKKDPTLSSIPIVFVTASISGESKQEFCGCECLARPVSRQAILNCIKRHL